MDSFTARLYNEYGKYQGVKSNFEELLKLYLLHEQIPTDERWGVFVASGMGEDWNEHLELETNIYGLFYGNPMFYRRGERIHTIEVVSVLTAQGYDEDDIKAIQNQVMKNYVRSFLYKV